MKDRPSGGRVRGFVAALTVIAVVVPLAACGGGSSGVARLGKSHAGSSSASSSSSGGGGAPSSSAPGIGASVKEISATGGSYSGAQLLKFAECARANGDPNFPDPNPQGAFVGIVPGSPESIAAQEKCSQALPRATPSPTQEQLFVKKAVVYAQCMRSHGVLAFPDPTSGGNLELNWRSGSTLDPSSPVFLRANRTCTRLHGALPGGL